MFVTHQRVPAGGSWRSIGAGFPPFQVNAGVELLQQEAVELPLAFGLLVVQQRTLLTGSPAHPGQGDRSGEEDM